VSATPRKVMSEKVCRATRVAGRLRIVDVESTPEPAQPCPELGLTLLTRSACVPASVVRAHAVKSCLEQIAAVHRRLVLEKASDAPQKLERAGAALERARLLVASDLMGPGERLPLREYCSAEEVVGLVIDRVRDRADDREVELWARSGRGGVRGDRDRLVDALENAMVNAIAASEPRTRVFLTARELTGGDQYWTVDDSGCGMPSEALGRLGTHRANATGGLAVAREIIEAHGGLMRVCSEPAIGTRVGFWLPRAPA